jgi:hypothetical protein
MSGGPRLAVLFPPGTRKAIEMCSKMLGWSLVIFPVGPKKTDQMSTHGMIAATSAAQATFSKYERNQKPSRTSANSFARLKRTSRSANPATTATTTSPSAIGNSPGRNASGSSTSTTVNVAGIRTSAMKRMSGQRPALHRRLAAAVYAAIVAVRPASASARRGPPSTAATLATTDRAP